MWTCSSATGSMRPLPRVIPRSVAGADVGVVVLHHVDRGFLRAGGPAVDADVAGDEILLVVRMSALVLSYQPTRPRIRAVVEQETVEVLVGLVRSFSDSAMNLRALSRLTMRAAAAPRGGIRFAGSVALPVSS